MVSNPNITKQTVEDKFTVKKKKAHQYDVYFNGIQVARNTTNGFNLLHAPYVSLIQSSE